jgi:DNA-binding beta-propeller fold protein YncE
VRPGALLLLGVLAGCRFGDFTQDASPIDAPIVVDASPDSAPADANVDAAPIDAMPDAPPDAMLDAGAPDAYVGPHPIGELGAGLSTLVGFSGPGSEDGTREFSLLNNPVNVTVGPSGDIYVADFNNSSIRVITPTGITSTLVQQAGFTRPFGMAFTPAGDFYVQTDRNSAGLDEGALWQVNLTTGAATLVIDSVGRPRGLASLSDGRLVLVDSIAHTVRLYDPATTVISDIAGLANTPGFVNGTGADARFDTPLDVVVTSTDDLYIADSGNNRIRFVSLTGVVATLAGNGVAASIDGNALSASFDRPAGLALEDDSTLYIAEFSSGLIRALKFGAISTVAGSTPGFADNEDPLQGQIYVSEGIDIAFPFLYISDGNGGTNDLFHRVRRLKLTNF